MKLFKSKPKAEPLVKVRVLSLVDCGYSLISVPVHIGVYIEAFHQRITELEAENDALVQAGQAMRDAYQREIEAHEQVTAALNSELMRAREAVAGYRDEVKRLDAELIETHGRLQDAEEQLAGYRLEVA